MAPPDEDDRDPREEERALIRRAKNDPSAFGELYEQHVERIYNYVYYRTGNGQIAEDLTAKVFERALKHIPRFKDKGVPFSAWLYRIAHNLVANWHRDQSRRPVVPLDERILISGASTHPEAETVSHEERTLLLQVVRELPADRQQLLILKFVERLPNAEIGEIMGRTEGAIKSLYHRTLNSLRDDLGKVMPDTAAESDR
jgi:RNA polymerase sigma-70 factor (ECF subfamily)